MYHSPSIDEAAFVYEELVEKIIKAAEIETSMKKILKEMAEDQAVTVLVSSHDLIHVTEVCQRIVVLSKGQVVRDIRTSPETLKELEQFFDSQSV